MKTAMKELIDWIECDNDNNVYDICDMAKELLEKEKKQIINAHFNGCEIGEMFNNENRAFIIDSKQYSNETFKSEI